MVHSLELVFDDATETAIRAAWARLAGAGIAAPPLPARPHVTLVVADRIGPGVGDACAGLLTRLPLTCRIGAPVLFGRDRPVLARLVVPSAALLDLHAAIAAAAAPWLHPGPRATTAVGRWSPHVTLARRLTADQLGPALRIAGRPAELAGRLVGVRHWNGAARTAVALS
ncbi:2'-5' RNA ligase family protein [Mycolicibacillus parakoreensis]|uniref:2'-5' RNA ligase family protein n=1 Tax=Mycolicibacillus parakoreensis TaxID=1069221 RepID=A0ABY3U6L8_9MYCO|nr:2'-5' RNA ligase family protein [Mycolicibacillus parakoreensis]MCV7316761.1 2'-5' RNA ligase family protein [Mycolicibacillus parakoreensis]ULN54382.1 2'-5' RNA ligase family protein [Mycolicibacillus parakoreensis]HLR99796.1 2'-5' RNA ligase family protein [Mycolicibacillus parakoreensis]